MFCGSDSEMMMTLNSLGTHNSHMTPAVISHSLQTRPTIAKKVLIGLNLELFSALFFAPSTNMLILAPGD
jgi:hypothetical protein